MLKAGMSKRDITPPLGLPLVGYPHYTRANEGAHDPLLSSVMYISNGECETVLVTLDVLIFSKRHVAEIRRRVEKECGIPGKNIMISCTHTHSGPLTFSPWDLESIVSGNTDQPWEYIEDVISKTTEAIVEAKKNAFAASFTSGAAMCGAESGVGGNRRIPGGPHDPFVGVLAVKDETGRVRGMYVNYALHPTFIHEWSNVCTSDYPYYVRLELEEQEKDIVVCFGQGASGNQSSRYYRNGESYDEAERVGRAIGRAAHTVLDNAEWKTDMPIKVVSEEIEFVIREFASVEELEAQCAHDTAVYKELYAKYGDSENRDEYLLWQNANLKCLGSENQLQYAKLRAQGIRIPVLEEENPAEIQVIRLGDACVVGVPGENFVEYALYIKAMAGFKTVIYNELANGALAGYLCTPESMVLGGYETDTSWMDVQYGKNMVNKAIELIENVK